MMYELYDILYCSIMIITILFLYRLADAQIVMENPHPFDLPPQYRWLQIVYALDISSRLEQIFAEETSVYGQFLKLDSTIEGSFNIVILRWYLASFQTKICSRGSYHRLITTP